VDPFVLAIFVLVYAGMLLGELPGLAIDRTGIALLGAIALIVSGRIGLAGAAEAIDGATLALLFGLMVVSAQFRLGGFYTHLTRLIAARAASPERLLALLVGASGLLSALLANDIVCLAMAPVVVEICVRRGLEPVPFLLALACAANVGSAATLIGNPQNMLIGQALALPFAGYLLAGGVPAFVGLAIVHRVVRPFLRAAPAPAAEPPAIAAPAFDRWQSAKGGLVLGALVLAFLVAPWPRELVALAAAGLLLCSRRMASREILGLVDWHLLVLFIGLFVVNRAFADTGAPASALAALGSVGVDLAHPAWLYAASALLSNAVSNVPAVMLLLPAAEHPLAGPALALASTLAGNLLVVGSIANVIVIEQAGRLGIPIDWRRHARVGIPVTLATLAFGAAWLALLAAMGAG
jgi:Na+/H+ antiporter NhaD/arsenite permease-like protein